MRETCNCGASFQGRRKDVISWRTSHRHPSPAPTPEPQKQGSHSSIERGETFHYHDDGMYRGTPPYEARIGFQPNPPEQP